MMLYYLVVYQGDRAVIQIALHNVYVPRSNLLGKVIHIWDTGIAMTPDFITIKTLSSRDILKFLYMRMVTQFMQRF